MQDSVKAASGGGWKYEVKGEATALNKVQLQSIRKYRIVEIGAMYYEIEKSNTLEKRISLRPFSNFIIRPLVKLKNQSKCVIGIENVYGVKRTVEISLKVFASKYQFGMFIESQGNFLFITKNPPFLLLKVKIYEQILATN
jgi:hypothetical protein